jgi:hypothetical protein
VLYYSQLTGLHSDSVSRCLHAASPGFYDVATESETKQMRLNMKYEPAHGSKIQRLMFVAMLADAPRLQKTVKITAGIAIHVTLVVVTVAVVGWALTL